MATQPLPTDRSALEAQAAELAVAERAIATRITNVAAVLSLTRQSVDRRFQGGAAQADLTAELGRLRAILAEPWPDLTISGPHLAFPDRGLAAAEYLTALHREVVRLRREVAAKLAKPKMPPKAKRKRGDTKNLCVGLYFAALAQAKVPPCAQEIADQIGCDRATAWSAIKSYEKKRIEEAKNKAKDEHERRGGPKKMRNK